MTPPPLSGNELVRILERWGFEAVRSKGSHVYLRRAKGRGTVVPIHAGRHIGKGLLRRIASHADLSLDGLAGSR